MELSSTKKIADQWLGRAYLNLQAARVMTQDRALRGLGCYHSHQAAEKALKGYLIQHRKGLPRIHDLEYLIILCMREDRFFQKLVPDGIFLNPFYIEMNYPVLDSVTISLRIHQRALKAAQNIASFVESSLITTPRFSSLPTPSKARK